MNAVREARSDGAHAAATVDAVDPRDRALEAALRDRLAHDTRVADLDLAVHVDGQVAHVRGSVGSTDERELVRRLLRDVNGLRAAWDLLTLPEQRLEIIDVGCGVTKQVPEALGVDQRSVPGVDIVTDLEQPLPLPDDSADHVFAVHVLEHIQNLTGLMDELHRVLRPSGVLHVLAPHWKNVNAVADPTHCRLIDPRTFLYWCTPRRERPWSPLIVTASSDTVFADLQPLKDGSAPDPAAVARWFD